MMFCLDKKGTFYIFPLLLWYRLLGYFIHHRRPCMKKIEAIIRPHKLDDVQDALLEAGVKGMTVYEARGVGRQKGHKEIYRGSEYEVGLLPKIKIEIIVPDALADRTVDVILKAAKTGEIGDGKVFISTIEEAIRVRTLEAGESAL